MANVERSLTPDEFGELLKSVSDPDQPTSFDKLHIKTVSFLVKRSQLFIMTPTQLAQDLKDLGLGDEKAAIFLNQWTDQLKPVLTNLTSDTSEVNDLEGLSWKLEVELVSSGLNRKTKAKVPIGTINLETTNGCENLQLDHGGLSQLFDTLEEVQAELDSLKT